MKYGRACICLLLICATMLGCISLTGCNKQTLEDLTGGTYSKPMICTASDFEANKDNWFGVGTLLSSKVKDLHTSQLVAGTTYYFVWSLKSFEEGSCGTLNFRIKTWGDMLSDYSAIQVDSDRFVVDARGGEIDVSPSRTGVGFDFRVRKECSHAYVAVPFTPQYTGILYADCVTTALFGAQEEESVLANITSRPMNAETSAEVSISNLNYGVVSQAVYESGQLDSVSDPSTISDLQAGRNYLVVDFDINSTTTITDEIYFGIYLYPGKWEDPTIEQVNTATFKQSSYGGGQLVDFSYTSLQNGTKKARIVLGLTCSSACSLDFDFFVYAEQSLISGTTLASGSIIDSGASALTYQLDEEKSVYYVTGYDTMTGMVVIPGYHQGLPVYGVDSEAFANCDELKTINLNKVQLVDLQALKECKGLNISDPHGVQTSEMRWFKDVSIEFVRDYTYAYSSGLPDVYKIPEGDPYFTNLNLDQNYYLMFDVYVSSGSPTVWFELNCESELDCELILREVICPDVWCQSEGQNQYSFLLSDETNTATRIRLIFELIPRGESQEPIYFNFKSESGTLWSIKYNFRIR